MLSELVTGGGAAAAVIVPAVLGAHALYFRRMARHSTQHQAHISDYSGETARLSAVSGGGSGTATCEGVVTLRRDRIVAGDFNIADNSRFSEPLKVTGDLIVVGRATFDQPVVVNGHVHIVGEASFHEGLLTKANLRVDGSARFGRGPEGAWCVAHTIIGAILPAAATAAADARLTA